MLNKKYAKVPDRERPKGGFAAEKIAAERQKDLIWFVRVCCLCVLLRGLENLEASRKGKRVVTFCIVQKVTKKHAGLRPATSIQIAGRYVIFSEMTGVHQVTG